MRIPFIQNRGSSEENFVSSLVGQNEPGFGKRIRRMIYLSFAIIFVGLIVSIIAFWGRPPHTPFVFVGMQPNFRYDAPFSFTYKSPIKTMEKKREASYGIMPVYHTNLSQISENVERYHLAFELVFSNFEIIKAEQDRAGRVEALKRIFREKMFFETDEKSQKNALKFIVPLSVIIESCKDKEQFKMLMTSVLSLFEKIASEGIYEDSRAFSERNFLLGLSVSAFKQNFSDNLKLDFWEKMSGDVTPDLLNKLVSSATDIFLPIIKSNMVFDKVATQKLEKEATSLIKDVEVKVEQGEALLMPNIVVSEESAERWAAYRVKQVEKNSQYGFSFNFFLRFCFVIGAFILAFIYSILIVPDIFKTPRKIVLVILLFLLNLGLIRFFLEISETSFLSSIAGIDYILGWLASPAIVAITVTVLIGAPMGILSSLMVSVIVSMMLGDNLEIMMTTAVAALVAVCVARDATSRPMLFKAGFYSGLAVAFSSLIIGVYADFSIRILLGGFVGAIGIGFFYGMISSGCISIFERLFKITSNITFFELSDHNHPLLNKLQLVAPGTYHHSLMVSHYAEQAARKVGANAVLCRCAGLYHDIGKILKPEYFSENQGPDVVNPHNDVTPLMSTLIIKSHVRGGVELAVEYHLPKEVKDLIEQHHGTTLITYFIEKAKQMMLLKLDNEDDVSEIDESQYRYDGPSPLTVEAAILMICDVVEASSRSMKRFKVKDVEDLVANVVKGRLDKGQFDLCPITIKQLRAIQNVLVEAVKITFHSRIEYPKEETKIPEKSRIRIIKRTVEQQIESPSETEKEVK